MPNFAQSGASRDTRAQIGCQILQQPSKLGSCNMKALFVSDKEKISIAENSAALMIIQATKLKRTSFPRAKFKYFSNLFCNFSAIFSWPSKSSCASEGLSCIFKIEMAGHKRNKELNQSKYYLRRLFFGLVDYFTDCFPLNENL